MFSVICTVRKHVSLFLVLSTECQQCKRSIYSKNIQNKAILKGSMWRINKKSNNNDWINKLFSEENKVPGTPLEARKVAGSAKIFSVVKKKKTCFFFFFFNTLKKKKKKKESLHKDLSLLIQMSSPKLHRASLAMLSWLASQISLANSTKKPQKIISIKKKKFMIVWFSLFSSHTVSNRATHQIAFERRQSWI